MPHRGRHVSQPARGLRGRGDGTGQWPTQPARHDPPSRRINQVTPPGNACLHPETTSYKVFCVNERFLQERARGVRVAMARDRVAVRSARFKDVFVPGEADGVLEPNGLHGCFCKGKPIKLEQTCKSSNLYFSIQIFIFYRRSIFSKYTNKRNRYPCSLHRHALGQVSRLVHVPVQVDRHVVGKQLERNHRQQRR